MTKPTSLAFPSDSSYGMNKREYFAVCLLQGILASEPCPPETPYVIEAEMAVRAADALIKELNRED